MKEVLIEPTSWSSQERANEIIHGVDSTRHIVRSHSNYWSFYGCKSRQRQQVSGELKLLRRHWDMYHASSYFLKSPRMLFNSVCSKFACLIFFKREIFYKQGGQCFHEYELSGIDESARMPSSWVLQKVWTLQLGRQDHTTISSSLLICRAHTMCQAFNNTHTKCKGDKF